MAKFVHLSAASVALVFSAGAAHAQSTEFSDAGASFFDHVAAICPVLAQQRDTATDEQDLFLRCNGALSEPAASEAGLAGLTSQNDILDQYVGVQNVAQQADAATKANRGDQAVSGRIGAVAAQMRGRQFAANYKGRPILLASNNPDEISLAAGPRESALDGFFTIGAYDGEQDSTASEIGFDQDGFWISAGLDYAFNDRFVGGAAVGYVDGSADFKSVGGLSSGGSMDNQSWSVSFYGVYLPNDKWEFNGLAAFGQAEFDNARRIEVVDRNGDATGGGGQSDPDNLAVISRTATSSSEADTIQIAAGGSYAAWASGAASLTPFAELNYYQAEIDGFSESGAAGLNLTFDEQEVDSLQASLGATWSYANSASWGVLVPYARGRAVFELEDDEQTVTARYTSAQRVSDSAFTITTNPADESSFDLAVGVSAVTAGGLTAFGEFSTVLGLDNVTHNALAFGLRREF